MTATTLQGFFARVTANHLACGLSPSAIALHQWGLIRSPAGISFTFELPEWQEDTSNFRPNQKSYSRSTFYRAARQLTEGGLMEIVMADRGKIQATFFHPETQAESGCRKNETASRKNETTPIYREKEIKSVCGAIEKILEGPPERIEEATPDFWIEPTELEQTPVENPTILEKDKYSAAPPPEFIGQDLWRMVIRSYPADAIMRAWENVKELGSRCRDAIAVFMYSLKYPGWEPMAAKIFDDQFRERTQMAQMTYADRRKDGVRPSRPNPTFLYPAGPWLDGKQMREDFVEWIVAQNIQRDRVKKGSTRSKYDVRNMIERSWVNDPSRVVTAWESYVAHCSDMGQNIITLAVNGSLKESDKERFIQSAKILKAVAEDEELDESRAVNKKAVTVFGRIQGAAHLLSGDLKESLALNSVEPDAPQEPLSTSKDYMGDWQESEVAFTKRIPTPEDTSEIGRCEMMQRLEEWENAIAQLPDPLPPAIDVTPPVVEEVVPEPEVTPQPPEVIQKAQPTNPRIAEIMQKMRAKKSGEVSPGAIVSQNLGVENQPVHITQDAQRLVLEGIAAIASKSSSFSKPLSPDELLKGYQNEVDQDLVEVSAAILEIMQVEESLREGDRLQMLIEKKAELEEEKNDVASQIREHQEEKERYGEEWFAERKEAMLRQFRQIYSSPTPPEILSDPYGGLDW